MSKYPVLQVTSETTDKEISEEETTTLTFPGRPNPFEKSLDELRDALRHTPSSDDLKKIIRETERFAKIWKDGYDATKDEKGVATCPWKNSPNRIVWGYGSIAARMDLDPKFASIFRTIITDKQAREDTLGRD